MPAGLSAKSLLTVTFRSPKSTAPTNSTTPGDCVSDELLLLPKIIVCAPKRPNSAADSAKNPDSVALPPSFIPKVLVKGNNTTMPLPEVTAAFTAISFAFNLIRDKLPVIGESTVIRLVVLPPPVEITVMPP